MYFIASKWTQLLLESHEELFAMLMQWCISFLSLSFDPLLLLVNKLLKTLSYSLYTLLKIMTQHCEKIRSNNVITIN